MLKHVKKEARHHTRVRFATRAEVRVNDEELHGDVVDMSMSGIFMRSTASVSQGDACEVRIMLGDAEPMVMHALGHVARIDEQGFAIKFSGFYCESDTSLKRVIMYQVPDPARVEKEIAEAPKLAVIQPGRPSVD